MGSKQMQQASALHAVSSVSRNITVRSSTARSASPSKEIDKCKLETYSLQSAPRQTSSSSFMRGVMRLSRTRGTPFGDCTSILAIVDRRRFQTSAIPNGWTHGKAQRRPRRRRQLLSSPSVQMPKSSETRIMLRNMHGESLQDDHRSCGNSKVPSISAKGVMMVTPIFTHVSLCLAKS